MVADLPSLPPPHCWHAGIHLRQCFSRIAGSPGESIGILNFYVAISTIILKTTTSACCAKPGRPRYNQAPSCPPWLPALGLSAVGPPCTVLVACVQLKTLLTTGLSETHLLHCGHTKLHGRKTLPSPCHTPSGAGRSPDASQRAEPCLLNAPP